MPLSAAHSISTARRLSGRSCGLDGVPVAGRLFHGSRCGMVGALPARGGSLLSMLAISRWAGVRCAACLRPQRRAKAVIIAGARSRSRPALDGARGRLVDMRPLRGCWAARTTARRLVCWSVALRFRVPRLEWASSAVHLYGAAALRSFALCCGVQLYVVQTVAWYFVRGRPS